MVLCICSRSLGLIGPSFVLFCHFYWEGAFSFFPPKIRGSTFWCHHVFARQDLLQCICSPGLDCFGRRRPCRECQSVKGLLVSTHQRNLRYLGTFRASEAKTHEVPQVLQRESSGSISRPGQTWWSVTTRRSGTAKQSVVTKEGHVISRRNWEMRSMQFSRLTTPPLSARLQRIWECRRAPCTTTRQRKWITSASTKRFGLSHLQKIALSVLSWGKR